MKRIVLASILALGSMGALAQTQLASLASVDGKILINKGKGFVAAKPGTALADGDRLIALDGARAAVVYPDGCVTQIKENSLLALEKAAGCAKEPVRTGGAQPLRYAQAIGGPRTDGQPSPPPPPGNPSVWTPTTLIVVGVTGLALGSIIRDYRRDSRPISPQ